MGKPMDRSKLLFMKEGPIDEAFPTIEKAEIEYVESEFGEQKGEDV